MDEPVKMLLEQIMNTQVEHGRKLDDTLDKVSKIGERLAKLEGRAGAIGTIAGSFAGAIVSFLLGQSK